MDHETNYVFSGSSSVDDGSTIYSKAHNKKGFVEFKPKYKKSTIKQNFGKKKRKRRFNKNLNDAQSIEISTASKSMETQSIRMRSTEMLSSLTQ